MPGRTNLKRSDHEFVTYFGLLTAFLFHSKPLFPLFTLFTFHTDAPYHHAYTSVSSVYLFTILMPLATMLIPLFPLSTLFTCLLSILMPPATMLTPWLEIQKKT